MARARGRWEPLGKRQGERYRNSVTGETISKRQFRNRQLKREGIADSLSEWERATQSWSNRRTREPSPQFSNHEARVRKLAQAKAVSDREARKLINAYTKQARKEKWSRDSDGALARMLTDMGVRAEDADYNVGETPRG